MARSKAKTTTKTTIAVKTPRMAAIASRGRSERRMSRAAKNCMIPKKREATRAATIRRLILQEMESRKLKNADIALPNCAMQELRSGIY